MPIRPENKARYPKDWPQISKAIRERAKNSCEKCGAPNGNTVLRGTSEDYHGLPCYAVPAPLGSIGAHVFSADTGDVLDARVVADLEREGWKPVKIVLTVAHLDHQPENCAPENLRAWCQRCHNIYDMPMRKAGIAARSRNALAVADLFGATP